ncbi:hypothetical protein ROZALSC1DRAFT_30324 [Rozella allomycis CSF55]|uniref:Uncharacterized protein n=1 Tax=Rozella allomycis (strain CSF55) TaxID=988480 RepID=A0A4P9YEP5_ROZAC|nr:hypothetical protein ROZALSC1DRAFT_30324 [Rozella allomycis CSF55]
MSNKPTIGANEKKMLIELAMKVANEDQKKILKAIEDEKVDEEVQTPPSVNAVEDEQVTATNENTQTPPSVNAVEDEQVTTNENTHSTQNVNGDESGPDAKPPTLEQNSGNAEESSATPPPARDDELAVNTPPVQNTGTDNTGTNADVIQGEGKDNNSLKPKNKPTINKKDDEKSPKYQPKDETNQKETLYICHICKNKLIIDNVDPPKNNIHLLPFFIGGVGVAAMMGGVSVYYLKKKKFASLANAEMSI